MILISILRGPRNSAQNHKDTLIILNTRPDQVGYFFYISHKLQGMKRELKIVFMGTPEFAVDSLKVLLENNYPVVGVITSPDAPSGRGQKVMPSPVKAFALHHSLNILQPPNLKDPQFLDELRALKGNLFIVVAFRMLPEVVWTMPEYGTFNLHASLLPQYRGAAPINWAIITGETETGVTAFIISHEIDTGKIIHSEKVSIGPEETAGELHDRLMAAGAKLVLKTVQAIEKGDTSTIEQSSLIKDIGELKKAPKIFKEDCHIDWNKDVHSIHNFVRGLSPYPGAYANLVSPEGISSYIKVYRTSKVMESLKQPPGKLITDGKSYLRIAVKGGMLQIDELQQAGKRKMKIYEFLRGFPIDENWIIS